MGMAYDMRNVFAGIGRNVLERLRETANARIDDAVFEAEIIGIEKATAALCEAGVKDEKIIALLQKYWDLRLSEAKEFLRREKSEIERG
jgi:hypothetical protein